MDVMDSHESNVITLRENQEEKTKRVQCFIDGYNLFHSIEDNNDKSLHWVDLKALCQSFLPKNTKLNDVFWFSAEPSHLSNDAIKNHSEYKKALEAYGVTAILGKFKRKKIKCIAERGCGQEFNKHEEKESDVNLAIKLVGCACKNEFDIAIVITADSDLCPPIRFVRDEYPDKEVWVIAPVKRKKRATDLQLLCCRTDKLELSAKQLRRFLMRDKVYRSSMLVAERPQEWQVSTHQRGRGSNFRSAGSAR